MHISKPNSNGGGKIEIFESVEKPAQAKRKLLERKTISQFTVNANQNLEKHTQLIENLEKTDFQRSFGDILDIDDHVIKEKIKETRVELKRTSNLT